MPRPLSLILSLWLAAGTLGAEAAPAEAFTVVETTNGKAVRTPTTLTRTEADGLTWETSVAKDTTNRVATAPDGEIRVAEVTGPQGKFTLVSDGGTLKVSGTWEGKPLTGTLDVKGKVWALGFDQPLKWYARKGLAGPMPFLMLTPGDLSHPTAMVLAKEGADTVKGRSVTRLKVSLDGAMALFWGAKLWADPATGRMVRYQGTKGPGTPESVIEVELPVN